MDGFHEQKKSIVSISCGTSYMNKEILLLRRLLFIFFDSLPCKFFLFN